mmetsp:Transcript_140145/g.254883  ORF Transcript_140145/g.254883 Transcript_140145/m.254883 type:complete len:301 (+) Transcript_140145:69-971(+)
MTPMCSIVALMMLVSSNAALKISPKFRRPELIQLLALPGQGSTALAQLFMSSENVATLCKGKSWQCEPCDLMQYGCNFMQEDNQIDIDALRNATDTWAQYWNLSRPLFLKKSMIELLRNSVVETHRMYLNMAAHGLSQRMQNAAIGGLRFAYVAMWRPLCLSKMSSPVDVPTMVKQLQHLSDVVSRLRKEKGARILVINYGSLIWDLENTKKRVESFLPEAGTLDTTFEPRMNIDIFPSNEWKVQGSLSSYASAHQKDAAIFGYNVTQQTCFKNDEFNGPYAHMRMQYADAVSNLRAMSM